jgi:hypothetical protein
MKWRRNGEGITKAYRSYADSAVLATSTAIGSSTRTNTLKPNSARTAEVIKAKYIRSVQQYRKICALIGLLETQHSKLDVRRRQLQRAMGALSAMYRLNKLRSSTSATTTTTGSGVASPPSAVSSSTSTSPPVRPPFAQQLLVDGSIVDLHHSVPASVADVVDYDYSREVMDCDFEQEMINTGTEAENMSTHWYTLDGVDAAAYADAPYHHHHPQPVELTRRQCLSPPILANAAAATAVPRGSCFEDRGYCSGDGRSAALPLRGDTGSVATYAAAVAHCKSNSIELNVPDYERPVAAHTCKADLSSYSYLQLCRQGGRRSELSIP